MEPHRHDENGDVILVEDTTPTPAEAEARALAHSAEVQAEAEVEVARVNADAAVQLAKIQRSTLEDDERVELEALRVEVAAMRELTMPPEPEADPDPAPVIINDAEPEPDMAPPVNDGHSDQPRHRNAGLGMW
jgi:hypothetical protein